MRLPFETFTKTLVGAGEVRVERLDRDLAPVPSIASLVNGAHASPAYLTEDLIVAKDCPWLLRATHNLRGSIGPEACGDESRFRANVVYLTCRLRDA